MSAEFSGGYGSIQSQPGGNQDESRSSGGYQSEGNLVQLPIMADISPIQTSL